MNNRRIQAPSNLTPEEFAAWELQVFDLLCETVEKAVRLTTEANQREVDRLLAERDAYIAQLESRLATKQ